MSDEAEKRTCPLPHPRHPDTPSYTGPAALICYGHIRKLRGNLKDLPTLHNALSDAHISWEQVIGYQSPGADEQIPISPEIADYRSEMLERVGSWVRIIAKARKVNFPECETSLLTPEPAMLQAMCSWLLIHVDWASNHPEYATDFSTAMWEVCSRAWSLRYPNRLQQIELEPCIETVGNVQCPGVMFAMMRPKDELFPKYIACNTCDKTIDSKEWYRYAVELRKQQEADPAKAA